MVFGRTEAPPLLPHMRTIVKKISDVTGQQGPMVQKCKTPLAVVDRLELNNQQRGSREDKSPVKPLKVQEDMIKKGEGPDVFQMTHFCHKHCLLYYDAIWGGFPRQQHLLFFCFFLAQQ